jgi:LSD1 subclass zinc finger protein
MSTSLETLACNNCGAQLQVPSGANYVTCAHCNSQLVVRRDPTVTYTQKLDQIDRRTEQMAEDIAHLRRHTEREQLADEAKKWPRNPSPGEKVFGMIFGLLFGGFFVVFGLFFAVSSTGAGAPIIFPIAGGFFAMIGVLVGVSVIMRAVGGAKDGPLRKD